MCKGDSWRMGVTLMLLALVSAFLLTGCSSGSSRTMDGSTLATSAPAAQSDTASNRAPGQRTVKFTVSTITWQDCVDRVIRNAQKTDGVVKVQGDLRSKTVTVIFDESKTNTEAIAAAIKAGGDAVAAIQLQ